MTKIIYDQDAFIIVDVQNDFCPGGALAVPEGDEVISIINHLVPHFSRIIATRDWHPSDHISFQAQGGPWPPHCVAGTKGAEFHPALHIDKAEIISKGTEPQEEAYSGFQGTDLADKLHHLGIRRVMIAGLAIDYCVKATALDALKNNFKVVVVVDATRGVNVKPGDSETALKEMNRAGARLDMFSNFI